MIKCLYLIGGMGADEQIFAKLNLGAIRTHFIAWKKVDHSETFVDYVQRLSDEINTEEEFGICGVSLGGITAQEMTRYVTPNFLILISTIKGHEELPPLLRAASSAKLYKVIPDQFYKWAALHSGSAVGMHREKDNALYHRMIDKFGEAYYKWCINAVAEWEGIDLDVPYLQLHGSKDVVFPSSYIKNAEIIKEGNHFMVMNMAREISDRIRQYLVEAED